jgi:hypothetical protein
MAPSGHLIERYQVSRVAPRKLKTIMLAEKNRLPWTCVPNKVRAFDDQAPVVTATIQFRDRRHGVHAASTAAVANVGRC